MIPITRNSETNLAAILARARKPQAGAEALVNEIVAEVKNRGDRALFDYTLKFDKHSLTPDTVKVTPKEIEAAYASADPRLVRVIQRAARRITDYHMKQKRNSWLETSKNGEILGQMMRPLDKVGVYVPGGKAAYPSSVLMNILPAKVAGVGGIIMVTPAAGGRIEPVTLVAAAEAGADTIYKIGGAQAVAALAFGTESIPRVDKIAGPGNIYVALAKRAVYGHVDIDSVAGPSEILVIADETANPVFVAADMLSQAEHDELASAVLVTDSEALALSVQSELKRQTELLERKAIIEASLGGYGALILVKDLKEAAELSNALAPEHLEVCVREPFSLLPLIQNAGAIFLGNYSPEPLGDYMAGPNHVLPTGGTARFFSPLSVDDFIKKSSVIAFGKEALAELAEDIIYFAEAEGLTAHANAIRVRKEEL